MRVSWFNISNVYNAEELYASLCSLAWEDLHVEERMAVVMILLGPGKTVAISASGVSELNLPRITKVKFRFKFKSDLDDSSIDLSNR